LNQKNIIKEEILKEPIDAVVLKGTKESQRQWPMELLMPFKRKIIIKVRP